MKTQEKTHATSPNDVVELGAASVETKGELIGVEFMGDDPARGISEQ
ncbi:hypothetical protein [Luteimonas sp. TWI1437]